jgi:hypothetical protein
VIPAARSRGSVQCGALLALLFLGFALGFTPVAATAGPLGSTWSQRLAPPLVIHFEEADSQTAEYLAEEGPGIIARLSDQTGLPVPERIDVILAADRTTFSAVQPAPPPIWAAGTAWSDRGEIYLHTRARGSGAGGTSRVFTHEGVHILLGRAWSEGSPPRWLNEGLARFLSHELNPQEHVQLARAAVAGYLLPFEDFAQAWPRGARRAHLAYIQSVEFVAFLDRQGPDVLPQLLSRLAAGEALAPAILAVTGESLPELEGRWRSRMTFWHGVFPVLGSSSFLWGLTSLLFLVAGAKRRRQNRAKIAGMASPGDPQGPEAWRQGLLSGRLDPPLGGDSHDAN